MPGPSKVIVLDPDARAGRQVRLGLSREGVPSAIGRLDGDAPRLELGGDDAGLVIVGGTDGSALDLLRKTRLVLDENKLDIPIVFTGRGVRRTDAEAAGADEVVLLPAFLRDVVTIGRLLKGVPAGKREHLVGSLAETTGVFTLVRALSALGRSAVLTLIRGLRRGEIRFFHGEVTSAQVGLIHGQAAFHQLLLWTEARFEFQHEDVVRRQQIPLSPDELFADAERFLEGVRDSSGQLSPSMVLEQDVQRVHALGKQIPTEVHGVLRMFDGHRVLADILEDSPYRVFETLRVAQRACDVGLLRVIDGQKPKPTWRTVLAIEEWLVGADRNAVIERAQSAADSGPVPAARDSEPKVKGSKRKRRKKRALTPPAMPSVHGKPEIDWGALVPRIVGAEVGTLSGVVPASHASGEIQMPTRDVAREKLEALMDTEKRERVFAQDVGLEPKVVFDDGSAAEARAKAKADADRAADDADAKVKVKAKEAEKIAADAKAKAADATAKEAAAARLRERAEQRAAAEDAKLRAEAADWAKQQAAARAKAAEDQAREAEEIATRLAATKAKSDAETRAKVVAEDDVQDEAMWRAAKVRAIAADAEDAKRAAQAAAGSESSQLVKQLRTPAIVVSETPTATVTVHGHITIDTTVNTARLTSEALASITSAAPEETVDGPSDGIVRQLTTVETAPVRRPPPPGDIPPDDRPEAKTGEISEAPRTKRPVAEPRRSEPSILVGDLAAAQSAVSAVVATQAAAPPSPGIATPVQQRIIAEVRKDAVTTFSDDEEAFFRAGADRTGKVPLLPPTDTFDDLDEGYQPVGFWDRLRGKKPPSK